MFQGCGVGSGERRCFRFVECEQALKNPHPSVSERGAGGARSPGGGSGSDGNGSPTEGGVRASKQELGRHELGHVVSHQWRAPERTACKRPTAVLLVESMVRKGTW
eukprot:4388164-Amphidinium_carterae.1